MHIPYQATIQFTATRELTADFFDLFLKLKLSDRDIVSDTTKCLLLERQSAGKSHPAPQPQPERQPVIKAHVLVDDLELRIDDQGTIIGVGLHSTGATQTADVSEPTDAQSSLGDNVRDAQRVVAGWSPEKRANVQLEGQSVNRCIATSEPTEAQRELTVAEAAALHSSLRKSVTVVARGRPEAQIEWPARADEGMLRAMIGWRECDEREGLSGETLMFDRVYHALYSHMRDRAALAAKEPR